MKPAVAGRVPGSEGDAAVAIRPVATLRSRVTNGPPSGRSLPFAPPFQRTETVRMRSTLS